jgi:ATP-binding cassette subfamily F protein 3
LDEDLDSYQRNITGSKDSRNNGGSKGDRKAERAEAAARRAEIAPIKSSIKDAETKISRLKNEIAKIEAQLNDPKIYNGPADRMIELGKDKARLAADLEGTEEAWLELSTQLEEVERA